MLTRAALIGLSFGLMPACVEAEPFGVISEVKFGVLAHDIPIIAADNIESGVDLNAEVIFVPIEFLPASWNIRPHIGVQANLSDYTSQAYLGLTTTHYLTDTVWGAFSGGGAIHNGERLAFGRDRKAFGSNVLFRLALEVGIDISDHVSVSLYYDHESNAFLAEENPGIDNVGMRIGWKF